MKISSLFQSAFLPDVGIFSAQIEHGQRAHSPHRLTELAEVLLRGLASELQKIMVHLAPMHVLFEKGQKVIVVPVVGKHLQDQGTMPQTAEQGGGEEGAVVSVGLSLPQGQKVFGTFSPVGNLGGFG